MALNFFKKEISLWHYLITYLIQKKQQMKAKIAKIFLDRNGIS